MGVESKLYDEMVAGKIEGKDLAYDASDMEFKPLPMPLVPASPPGTWVFDDPTTNLQKRVDELEHQMEQMVALFEELLNERERFETTHRLESREGPFASDFKTA